MPLSARRARSGGSRWARLIDIHTHVLPGVDDGAPDEETAIAMCKMAAEAGTTDLVLTPHNNAQFPFDPQQTEEKRQELQTAIGEGIHLHRGCDLHLEVRNIEAALANPSDFTINGHNYLLVEFSEEILMQGTARVFQQFQEAGIVSIVTHPERNRLLRRNLRRLAKWIERGCLLQVTGQSFLGSFGERSQEAAIAMMDAGLVHFVASDSHDLNGRPPTLDEAYEAVLDRWGDKEADRLFIDHPWSALWGERIEPPPARLRRRRWWTFG